MTVNEAMVQVKSTPDAVCIIHPKALRNLIALTQVRYIRWHEYGISHTIISDGDSQLNADDARAQFSIAGAGVKIGVISDGALHMNKEIKVGGIEFDWRPITDFRTA